VNATYDILQAIMAKPPVQELAKPRSRKLTTKDDANVMALIKKLSAEELAKLMKM
jgi:hypothetical protein